VDNVETKGEGRKREESKRVRKERKKKKRKGERRKNVNGNKRISGWQALRAQKLVFTSLPRESRYLQSH
jgi:hypothetical protein